MSVHTAHLDAVLEDLKFNRKILLSNLADIDKAIKVLQRLYSLVPVTEIDSGEAPAPGEAPRPPETEQRPTTHSMGLPEAIPDVLVRDNPLLSVKAAPTIEEAPKSHRLVTIPSESTPVPEPPQSVPEAPVQPDDPPAPVPVAPHPVSRSIPRHDPEPFTVKVHEPAPKPQPPEPEEENNMSMTAVVKKVVRGGRYTQTFLAREVLKHRPGSTLASVQTTIYMMLKDRRLHKGDDLIIRNVGPDGKVEDWPVPKGASALSSGRFTQYSSPTK